MPRTTYPTDSDVAAFAASVPLPSGYTFTGMAAAAVAEWERRTGYLPFLGSGVSTSRSFDPPGPNRRTLSGFSLLGGARILDLQSGLYGLTSVSIGVGPSSPGTALVSGADFWLEPLNADAMGVPWQRLRFRAPVFGLESSVVVVGSFGYGSVVPDDAWQAIARLGCSLGLAALTEGMKLGAVRWAEENVSEAYDPVLIAAVGETMRAWAERVLAGYRRVEL
ncbi:MAG: hypothetical protein ACYC96_15210 [Fimbriimonadaceae bacterium]